MAFVIVIAALAVGLIVIVLVKPSIIGSKGGRALALLAFLVLPVAGLSTGFIRQFERAKSNEFCFGCHIMLPYGESLHVDDTTYVPANHYQNKRIDTEEACYACHGDYTIFGDIKVKMRGLKQAIVYYLGRTPDELHMYEPFPNSACLHCHDGARAFQESPIHSGMIADLREDTMSCLDCHGVAHNVAQIETLPMWDAGQEGE